MIRSKRKLIILLSVTFSILMVTSLLAPAGAAMGDEMGTAATDKYDFSLDESIPSSIGTDDPDQSNKGEVIIDENTFQAEGTVEVLVSAEDVELPIVTDVDVKTALQTTAEESQEPIVEYAESTEGVEVLNQFWITNALLLELDKDQVSATEIAAQEGVESIDYNADIELDEPVEYDDDVNTTYGLDQINAPDVWDDHDTMGEGAEIAILDTGVDPDHPDIDIEDENWAEFDEDGEQVDSDPYESHSNGHGTHVSGTATGGNASGEYIGVAPEADLMHGLVLDAGSGSLAQIIGGIEWAVEEDADAVSMSLGVSAYEEAFIEPQMNALDAGTLVIASSGNDGEGSSSSPGNDYDSFAIGATDESEDIAQFSSGEWIDTQIAWGSDAPDHWPEEYVVPDIAAPGVGVNSAQPDGEYDTLSGTSMAAPHVAGTVGLMAAASEDDLSPEQYETAMTAHAWQPDNDLDDPNDRFGQGILDASHSVDQVAADQGINGTITDSNGDPIEGVDVELDSGYSVSTDENGEYTLRGTEDTFEFEASAFGYESVTETVEVSEGEFEQIDITLEDFVDAEPTTLPTGIVSGQNNSFAFETAHLEELSVSMDGNYDEENATLYVDGQEIDFNEAWEAEEPFDEVEIDLYAEDGTTGEMMLEFVFADGDDEFVFETDELEVFAEEIDTAVVDAPDGEFGALLASDLDDNLDANYNITTVDSDEVVDRVDDFDTFVVQRFADSNEQDEDLVREFFEATDRADIGVVYLDQYDESGSWSDSIHELSRATGVPGYTDQDFVGEIEPVEYEATEEHPILDGVVEEGERVELYDTPDHTWFGGHHGNDIADVGWKNNSASGHGLATDDARNNVYAASLGYSTLVGDVIPFTEEAEEVLTNSVEHVSESRTATLDEDQPDRVDPGEAISAEFSVDDIDDVEITVELDDYHTTTAEENLTLYVQETEYAFGEPIEPDEPIDPTDTRFNDAINVTVVPEDGETGIVALEHDIDVGGESVDGFTGPTSVYEPPIEVGEEGDAETIQDAVDLAIPEATIVVEDGTYKEQVVMWADANHDVTIEAAEDAEPSLELPDDAVEMPAYNLQTDDQTPVVYVRHNDGVTIDGFDIDAGGEVGSYATEAHNYTVSDVTVTNASTGLWSDLSHIGHVVEDSYIEADETGVFYYWAADDGLIQNNTITGADTGIMTDHVSSGHDVVDNEIYDVGTGMLIDTDDGETDRNVITDADVGIQLGVSGNVESVDDNHIENASVGLDEGSVNMPPEVHHNYFDSEVGVIDGDWNGPPSYYLNDFSESDTVIETDQRIDVRMNYLGERDGQEPIADGPTDYSPHLTSPPSVEEGMDTTEIGYHLQVEANESYGIGLPGPSEQTIGEIVPANFEGAIYGFDADEQEWKMKSGDDSVDTLAALVVVSESDAKLDFNFQSDDDNPSAPGQHEFEEGWNYVTAPAHLDAESAFEIGSFEPEMIMSLQEAPGNQLGPEGELDRTHIFGDGDAGYVSPFEGYFVYSESDGTMPSQVAADPTAEEMFDELNISAHEDHPETATIESVIETEGVSDKETEEALIALIKNDLMDEIEDANNSTEQFKALDDAAETIVSDAPDEHETKVQNATSQSIELVIQAEFGQNIDVEHFDQVVDDEDEGAASSVSSPSLVTP